MREVSTEKVRFAFIDALRGVAALAVVLLHLYHYNLVRMTGYRFPEPLHTILDNGQVGVYVFFVISGFVIAQSIHGETVTPRFAGRFALRRAVRLDLPYWATIAAMVTLTLVSNNLQHERSLPVPSVTSVAVHLVYAQQFLGYPHIVGVFWTLCYEVQFYLTLILVTGMFQRLARNVQRPAWLRSRWLVALPLWGIGLVCATGRLNLTEALFLYCWPFFFLGVAVNWAHNRLMRPGGLVGLVLTLAGTLYFVEFNHHFEPPAVGAAIATALAIYFVSRSGRLVTLTLGSVLQYLGRISYSLYLVHMLFGTPSLRLGIRVLGKRAGFVESVGLILIALTISVIAAHVMYVLVERPATRLSRRLFARVRRPESAAAVARVHTL